MDCTNHSATEAVDRCAGCARDFCQNCLVKLQDQAYCGRCKYAILGDPLALADRIACRQEDDFAQQYSLPNIPETCDEADDALKYSLIGIVCLGACFF